MTGKWALEPRKLCWAIRDRLAVAERPGGYGRNHPKVRLQEEITRLREHDFTRVVSLLDSPHNLHTYEEIGMPHPGGPGSRGGELVTRLPTSTPPWPSCSTPPQRVLVHLEDFGDRLCGVRAGYLLYAGLLEGGPVAISSIERLTAARWAPRGGRVAVTLEEGLAGQESARSPGER